MPDFADLAADREQEIRSDALAEQARQSAKRQVAASAETCAVCGEPIPEQRRQAVHGVQTCIDCQQELESCLTPCRSAFR